MKRLCWLIAGLFFLTGCTNHAASVRAIAVAKPTPHLLAAPAYPKVMLPSQAISTQQVVLLLPLSGNLEPAGIAVKEGFMAAAQQAGATNMSVEAIDTNEVKPISVAYQRAVAKGASIIIGPLEKKAVTELAAANNLPITVLALNYVKHTQAVVANLYEFGLSPLDEARQAADGAYQAGHRVALAIVPAGAWGDGVSKAFQERWANLGGTQAGALHFKLQDDLSTQIRTTLGISGNGGRVTASQRHQDFDVVFLAAPPAIARQVKPLLKFYYAGKIPIYATSFIYTGTPQPQLDQDLNGIIFCDIPWVLQSGQTLSLQLASQNPRNFAQNSRLYALGVDAYRLVTQLNDIRASSGVYIKGATGNLYLAKEQRFLRKLPWAIFRHGLPEILPEKPAA